MALFAILWVLSPLVLIPLLISYFIKNKDKEKRIGELEALLRRANSTPLKKVEPVVRPSESEVKPLTDKPAETVAENKPSENVSVVETLKQQMTDAAVEAESKTDIESIEPVVTKQLEYGYESDPYAPPVYVDKPEKNKEKSGVYMFGIGVLLVLIAGTIFATTTWKSLGPFGKIAVLLSTVAVFYASAWIAENKLKLRQTSIAFFTLGSGALAFINLAAAYFGWFGDRYIGLDEGAEFVAANTCMILTVCLAAGCLLYLNKHMSWISYCFSFLAVILYSCHFAQDALLRISLTGLYLIISLVVVCLHRRNIDEDELPGESEIVNGFFISAFSYVYILVSWMVATFGYADADIWDTSHVPGLYLMAAVAVVLAAMLICERHVSKWEYNHIIGISALLSVDGLFMADRLLPYAAIRVCLAWVVILALYGYLVFTKKYEKFKLITLIFVQVLALWALMSTNGVDSKERLWFMIVICLVSAVQYYIHGREKRNYTAFVSGLTLYISMMGIINQIFPIITLYSEDKYIIITGLLLEAIVAVTVIVGRFLHKPIIRKDEERTHIEWCSVIAVIPSVAALCDMTFNNVKIGFFAQILFVLYLLSFKNRIRPFVEKIVFTFAAVVFSLIIGLQPFVEIPDMFTSEWVILVILMGTALLNLIHRENKKAMRILWTVSLGVSIFIQLLDINSMSYDGDTVIQYYKIAIYLAGIFTMFAVSYVRKNNYMLIETGFGLMMFSLLSSNLDILFIYILAAVIGLAYMLYLHYVRLSVWAWLPVVQIYILMYAYDPPRWAWMIAFAVSIVAGFVLHRIYDGISDEEHRIRYGKTLMDDWINVSAILPVLHVINSKADTYRCLGFIMLSIFVLSFYRRYNDDKEANINRRLLTASSIIMLIAWLIQPWFEISDQFKTEWWIIGIMITALFNMICVYKADTDDKAGWVTFFIATGCLLWQLIDAIVGYDAIDSVELGVVLAGVIAWSFMKKRKQWFGMSSVFLILLLISCTRVLWMSIAWWVYLLLAGAVLIGIAAKNEYNKHHKNGYDQKSSFTQRFDEWTY
ncbi:MAG: hypothetical protein J5525_08535 [Lachnospiraceae bacterium]|nr:hypothetical protein [Lachnospiraceae bacterium]